MENVCQGVKGNQGKLCSQTVNLPGAWPLMKPLEYGQLFTSDQNTVPGNPEYFTCKRKCKLSRFSNKSI